MAIKVGGTTVVSDARLIQNTKFCDTARAVTVSSGTTAIDLSSDDASVYRVAMGASTTITFSNPQQGQSWVMITTNSSSGYTIAFGNTVKFAGGTLPTRTTATSAVDVWTFYYDNSTYYGSLAIINAS
jgi:hypothetical protein